MANPRVVWSGNSLPFPAPPSLYEYRRKSNRNLLFSDGSVSATILRSNYDEVRCVFEKFPDAQFERDLRAFWSYACQGKPFSFSLDTANEVNKAMTAVSQPTGVYVPDTAGIIAGIPLLLRQASGIKEEIVIPLTVNPTGPPSPNFTTTTGLKYTYAAGDIVRSRDYFPNVVALDSESPISEQITTWTLDLRFREDRG